MKRGLVKSPRLKSDLSLILYGLWTCICILTRWSNGIIVATKDFVCFVHPGRGTCSVAVKVFRSYDVMLLSQLLYRQSHGQRLRHSHAFALSMALNPADFWSQFVQQPRFHVIGTFVRHTDHTGISWSNSSPPPHLPVVPL
jgi:hypothetical protein